MALDPPSLSDFRARYPAFAAVSDDTVTYWLQDATREVDESWPIESDRDPAMMAVAAHNMIANGVTGIPAEFVAAAKGLTRWRSGSADLQFSEAVVSKALAGDYTSTSYGEEYLRLLRRNKGGPSVTAAGHVPCVPLGSAGPFSPYGGW